MWIIDDYDEAERKVNKLLSNEDVESSSNVSTKSLTRKLPGIHDADSDTSSTSNEEEPLSKQHKLATTVIENNPINMDDINVSNPNAIIPPLDEWETPSNTSLPSRNSG